MSIARTALSFRSFRPLILVAAIVGLFVVQSQATTVISLPNFTSTAGLSFAGNATTATTTDGTVLRVTPAQLNQSGAAYTTSPVTLGAGGMFSTTFQFRFTTVTGIAPADGITFVLAKTPTGLGSYGGAMGYGGSLGNSLAIEFDTFNNGGGDSSGNHIAVDTNGQMNNTHEQALYGQTGCSTGSNFTAGCMSNGDLWSVSMSYDGANLSLSVWDKAGLHQEAAPFIVYSALPINLSTFLSGNSAYVGFTSGTGGGYENHDILNWQFDIPDPPTPGVPEPATMAMLFGGLGGIAFVKRRRS